MPGSQFANYISRTVASAITSNITSIITPVGINMARSCDGCGRRGADSHPTWGQPAPPLKAVWP
jgi:hypothetical protein